MENKYRPFVGFFKKMTIDGKLVQFQMICTKGPIVELQTSLLQLREDIADDKDGRWMEAWSVLERVRRNPQYQGWDGIMAFVAVQPGNLRVLQRRAEAILKRVFPPRAKAMVSLILINDTLFKKIKKFALAGGLTFGGHPERN